MRVRGLDRRNLKPGKVVSPVFHDTIAGALARIIAYFGGLAILVLAASTFLRLPAVEADANSAAPSQKWIEVERPHPAFGLVLPGIGTEAATYAIRRREADDARKDILAWGEAAGSEPYVMVEIDRPGAAGGRFLDAASEIGARIVAYTVADDVKPAGVIDTKFGRMPLVDFAIAGAGGTERRCLGFARTFAEPVMQIVGWYCSPGDEVVERAALSCTLDRLTLISAGGEPKLAELFARAEVKRSFCGQRSPILAATPERRADITSERTVTLRGRLRM